LGLAVRTETNSAVGITPLRLRTCHTAQPAGLVSAMISARLSSPSSAQASRSCGGRICGSGRRWWDRRWADCGFPMGFPRGGTRSPLSASDRSCTIHHCPTTPTASVSLQSRAGDFGWLGVGCAHGDELCGGDNAVEVEDVPHRAAGRVGLRDDLGAALVAEQRAGLPQLRRTDLRQRAALVGSALGGLRVSHGFPQRRNAQSAQRLRQVLHHPPLPNHTHSQRQPPESSGGFWLAWGWLCARRRTLRWG
jgi:hypothetical protein